MTDTISMKSARTYGIDELCALTQLPRRTIRYYIQMGLVDSPQGETRAARYSAKHLERLLAIQKWTNAGLSLDAIRELLDDRGQVSLPAPRRKAGSVEVWSHLVIAEGVELMIEPSRSGLSPGQVRSLVRRCMAAFNEVREEDKP